MRLCPVRFLVSGPGSVPSPDRSFNIVGWLEQRCGIPYPCVVLMDVSLLPSSLCCCVLLFLIPSPHLDVAMQ